MGRSSITSSKRWVGGVKKWKFLMIYSTVNHQRGGWVGLKKSKTWWRNTWMPPYVLTLSDFLYFIPTLRDFWFFNNHIRRTPTQNNFQYKKQGPSPISLVRATRIFSKAKTMKKKMICHWTFEKKEKEVFFRLTTFFFRNKKILSKEQLLFSFLCIVKQKKISERSEKKILKIFLTFLEKISVSRTTIPTTSLSAIMILVSVIARSLWCRNLSFCTNSSKYSGLGLNRTMDSFLDNLISPWSLNWGLSRSWA